jgi:hypothetical protein
VNNPQARRKLPEYSGINHFVQDRSSQYHSMQLTLNRRFANGFTVNTNYTLSDLKGTIGGPELVPYFHPDFDTIVDTLRYGRLDDMRRHRFVTSWVYDIPGPTSGGWSHAIGGWQVTGIYQWQSGQPYTITSGVDNAGWGWEAIARFVPASRSSAAGLTRRSGSTRPHLPSTRTEALARRFEASSLVPTARRSTWVCSSGSRSRIPQSAIPGGVLQSVQYSQLQQPGHHGELASDIRPDHRGAGSAHHAVWFEVLVLAGRINRRSEGQENSS